MKDKTLLIEAATNGVMNRRSFLTKSIVTTAGVLAFPYVGRVLGANDRINVACIGVGGKGDSDTESAYSLGGNIVGLCDVDATTLDKKYQHLKDRASKENRTFDAKKYKDFRKMLEELDKSIDAVTVSTPDHVHGCAGVMAMRMGKHVYCQKPLTQTV